MLGWMAVGFGALASVSLWSSRNSVRARSSSRDGGKGACMLRRLLFYNIVSSPMRTLPIRLKHSSWRRLLFRADSWTLTAAMQICFELERTELRCWLKRKRNTGNILHVCVLWAAGWQMTFFVLNLPQQKQFFVPFPSSKPHFLCFFLLMRTRQKYITIFYKRFCIIYSWATLHNQYNSILYFGYEF